MSKTTELLLILFLGIMIFGCVGPGNGSGNQNTTLTAQYGDNVTVDYTLRVDGKVLDTSLESEAKAAGIYNANRTYEPLSATLLLDSGMINGFVKGIVGMQVNESKNFTVSPEDGYGIPDPSKTFNLSQHYNMSVFEQVPMSYLTSLNITPEVDKVFPTKVGYIAVENMTNDTVTLRYMLTTGSKFVVGGLPQSVENMTNDTMLIKLDVIENGTYLIEDSTGKKKPARVTSIANGTVFFDENNPLAGKGLDFEVELRSISR